MKYLCPSCERFVELTQWSVEGLSLVLVCPLCAAQARVEKQLPAAPAVHEAVTKAKAAAAAADPFTVPAECCPKCIARKAPQALACPQCGLDFSRPASDVAPSMSPALREAWLHLLAHWDDGALHEGLLQRAVTDGELAPLGWLYRLRLAWVPSDARAARGRDEVLRRAVLSAPTTEEPKPKSVVWQYGLVMAVLAVTITLIGILVRMLLNV